MIAFVKDYTELLPYDNGDYWEFLYGDAKTEWLGISIQHNSKEFSPQRLDFMRSTFIALVEKYESGKNWYVNHCTQPDVWFERTKRNEENTLPDLRSFFKKCGIKIGFVGAMFLPSHIILNDIIDAIVTYPYKVFPEPEALYSDLDISHPSYPLIIHISAHQCIDVLTKDRKIIEEVKTMSYIKNFNLIEYRNNAR